MKFLNKISKVLGILAIMVVVGSCSMFDLNVNKDPNNPATTTPALLLTNIQTGLFSEFAGIEGDLETYVGMIGTQNLSRWDLQNSQYDGAWQRLYRNPIKDTEKLLEATDGVAAFKHYRGIAQVLKAYTYGTMVDLFGDVPFSEASQGDAKTPITLPKFDKDADVYAAVLKLLDEAITNLAATNQTAVAGDLVYGNSAARWSKLAKTLKLKFLITGRKGITGADAQINTLIASGGFLSGTTEDFRFQFSKDPTSTRHPWYTGAYTGGEFDYTYITHQFMMETYLDLDPRARFYFRHLSADKLNFDDVTEKNTAPCVQGGCVWGYIPRTRWADSLRARGYDSLFVNGIFGHDRGDATGIPADADLRTIPGVYPCGGYYNLPLTKSTGRPAANAATGGGIFPALTEVNVIYYQIEAILVAGGTGDAKLLFADAMRKHISRVVAFGQATDAASVAPTTAAIDAYVARWIARYDAAPAASKLDVVMKQLWHSSWGNGFEIYNAYRRTGFPSSIQTPINASPKGASSYIYRMPYPISELNLNKSMTEEQKNMKYWINKVFWNK